MWSNPRSGFLVSHAIRLTLLQRRKQPLEPLLATTVTKGSRGSCLTIRKSANIEWSYHAVRSAEMAAQRRMIDRTREPREGRTRACHNGSWRVEHADALAKRVA